MTFSAAERAYVEAARVGRLATADDRGRPSVVPICFALLDGALVTPLDEKPKTAAPTGLRRVRDIERNPAVAVVIDDYSEDWATLRWLQVRGRAALLYPGDDRHPAAVAALRGKYDQYRDHGLEERPVIHITPGHVRSWRAG
jgi:PPOX class probable F420-dependent enzyme